MGKSIPTEKLIKRVAGYMKGDIPKPLPAAMVRAEKRAETGQVVVLGDLERGFLAFHFRFETDAVDFAEWAAGRVEGGDSFDVLPSYSPTVTRRLAEKRIAEWKAQLA